MLGALVGAPLVVHAPVRLVQTVVGFALLIAACLYAMSNLDLMPIGGSATALPAAGLVVAVVVHFPLQVVKPVLGIAGGFVEVFGRDVVS